MKGRQEWRPVAPIVPKSRVKEFFIGPSHSPYMNFVHHILPEFQDKLKALSHPDGSSRAQTLNKDDDPELLEILLAFEEITGFPILVNTSLNGAGQPIMETPMDAVIFFLTKRDIDYLILGDKLVQRTIAENPLKFSIVPGTLLSSAFGQDGKRNFIFRKGISLELSDDAMLFLNNLKSSEFATIDHLDQKVQTQLIEAVEMKLLLTTL